MSAIQKELETLSRLFKTKARAQPPLLVDTDYAHIWQVNLSSGQKVYMSCDILDPDDGAEIVMVDTQRFYYEWLKSRGEGFDNHAVLKSQMKNDHKFSQAKEGFIEGFLNPVPVADVSVLHINDQAKLCFTGGITRTYWLIVNEAESFPVLAADPQTAEFLRQKAGCKAQPKL